jgi:hypothetical protein
MFSEIVYRGYGPHQRKGGGFSTLGVRSEEELDAALKDGWYRTLPEAIEAHDKPKAIAISASESYVKNVQVNSVSDEAPPTRAELEQKAKELGIKFDGRTGDATLARKIAGGL